MSEQKPPEEGKSYSIKVTEPTVCISFVSTDGEQKIISTNGVDHIEEQSIVDWFNNETNSTNNDYKISRRDSKEKSD